LRATEGSEAISYEKNTDFLFKEIAQPVPSKAKESSTLLACMKALYMSRWIINVLPNYWA